MKVLQIFIKIQRWLFKLWSRKEMLQADRSKGHYSRKIHHKIMFYYPRWELVNLKELTKIFLKSLDHFSSFWTERIVFWIDGWTDKKMWKLYISHTSWVWVDGWPGRGTGIISAYFSMGWGNTFLVAGISLNFFFILPFQMSLNLMQLLYSANTRRTSSDAICKKSDRIRTQSVSEY